MLAVLQAKFQPGTWMEKALLATGDAFLLEHNSVTGRDNVWSDNHDGTGSNWLGLQLMLLRGTLNPKSSLLQWIDSQIDRNSGQPWTGSCWQAVVQEAAIVAERQRSICEVVRGIGIF